MSSDPWLPSASAPLPQPPGTRRSGLTTASWEYLDTVSDNQGREKKTGLTVYNDEVTEDQNHGMAGEYEVSAVHVVAVDAQAEAGHDLDDPVKDLGA